MLTVFCNFIAERQRKVLLSLLPPRKSENCKKNCSNCVFRSNHFSRNILRKTSYLSVLTVSVIKITGFKVFYFITPQRQMTDYHRNIQLQLGALKLIFTVSVFVAFAYKTNTRIKRPFELILEKCFMISLVDTSCQHIIIYCEIKHHGANPDVWHQHQIIKQFRTVSN